MQPIKTLQLFRQSKVARIDWMFRQSFSKPKLSLEKFKYALENSHRQLESSLVQHTIITDQNKDQIIEMLRHLTEMIVWGDQNEPLIFEYSFPTNPGIFWTKIC